MGFGLLAASLIFFFTPNIDIIDVLPDFIGVLLIMKGLTGLADITPELSETKRSFLNVFYVSIAKFFLMFFVPYFNNHDKGYILIFTFTFAVFELVFLLPAFRRMLDSLLYLGDNENYAVLYKKRSDFYSFTAIFFIVRSVFALIPELTFVLSDEARGIVRTNTTDIANYKGVLVAFNLIIAGIVGVVWLILGMRYFNGLRKDKEFINSIRTKYEKVVADKKGIFVYRRLRASLVLLIAGSVFMLDIISEKIDLLPDFLGAAFFVLSAVLIKKQLGKKGFLITSSVFLPVSAASWALSVYFAEKYLNVNLFTNVEANDLFIKTALLHALSSVVLGLTYFFVYLSVRQMIDEHTDAGIEDFNSVRIRLNEDRLRMKKQNVTVLVLGLISCVLSAVRVFLLFEAPVFWMADIAVKIIWLYVIIDLFDDISYSMEYKYL